MHNTAGDATNFPKTVPLVDDADLNPPTASNLDLIGQALADRTAYLRAQASVYAVSNWNAPGITSAIIGVNGSILAATWDAFHQQWIVAATATGTTTLSAYSSITGGATWFPFFLPGTASPATIYALACNTLTGAPFAIGSDASGNKGVYSGAALGTFTTQGGMAGATAAACVCLIGSVSPNPLAYVVAQSGGTFTGRLMQSGNTSGTGAWSNISLAGAPNFLSGTNHVGRVLVANSLDTDPGGAHAMFAICGVTPVTDTARLLFVTENGSAGPTEVTFAGLTGKIVTGVYFDSFLSLWCVLANDGTNAYVYTATDPTVAWTLKKTFAGVTATGGLGGTHGVFVAHLQGSTARVVYSGDGGATWGTARANPDNGSNAQTTFVSGTNQVMGLTSASFAHAGVFGLMTGGGF